MAKSSYTVPSRIAINLYDLNASLGRVDGGMGFSLEFPRLRFTTETSNSIELKNKQLLGDDLSQVVERTLLRLKEEDNLAGATFTFLESIPAHSGFGSKTATLISTAYALGKANGINYDFRELAIRVKRGGTSGLGINLIDKGGFVLEGGHSTKYKKAFRPSSASKTITIAPVLAHYNFPYWDVLLASPNVEKTYGSKEVSFFERVCPVPEADVEHIARATLSQCLPGLMENDQVTFGKGLQTIQEGVWKSAEISQYGSVVKDIMAYLSENGATGVGMSSMGPCVYAFGNDLQSLARKLQKNTPYEYDILTVTKANNTGIRMEDIS